MGLGVSWRRPAAVWLIALSVGALACQKLRTHDERSTNPAAAAKPDAVLALAEGDARVAIELLLPKSSFPTPTPELHWTALDQAAAYDTLVDDSEDCTSPLQRFTTDRTSITASFLANGVYYVCVTAKAADGKSLARTTGTFWVLAQDVADPAVQNGQGGSGGWITTPGLMTLPYFQDDWTTKLANRDGRGPRQNTVGMPYGFAAFADPEADSHLKFLVNDRGNRRVLIFPRIPDRPDALPTVVVGQVDFETARRGGATGGVNNAGFADNVHASVCPGGQLLVTDRGNHRVLVWQQIPTENGAPADLVIGQPRFDTNAAGTGAASLDQPAAAYCMGGKLLVVDRGNARILVWNHLPRRSGTPADVAIGQPDLTSAGAGCAEDRLNSPTEALYLNGRLLVTDTGNHRVLVFPSLPSTNGAEATAVLGQANLKTCRSNRGGDAGTGTLAGPTSLAAKNGLLAVGDAGNHRVLIFPAPWTTGMEATGVVGQTDFQTTRLMEPPEFAAVDTPRGLLFDGSMLWIGDSGFHRLMVVPVPQ